MVSFLLKAPKTVGINGLEELFVSYPEPAFILKDDTTELMVWGDPIPGESFNKSFPQNRKVDFILDNLYGHYYFILLNPRSGRLIVGNSYSAFCLYITMKQRSQHFFPIMQSGSGGIAVRQIYRVGLFLKPHCLIIRYLITV
jgi:hypothetical protein